MNTRIKYYLFTLCAALGAASCSSTKMLYTSIDVLRPAEVVFPANVNSLLLVNNSAPQPQEMGHTTSLLDGSIQNISLNTDSLSLFVLSALNEELDNAGFFANNSLVVNSINTGNDFSKITPIPAAQLQSLCADHAADAVLSLNSLQVNDALDESVTWAGTYSLGLYAVYDTWWTVQYADAQKQTELLHYQDTIYWESEGDNSQQLLSNFPNRDDALVDGALYVGQKMLNRLIPYWEENDRYLFDLQQPLMLQGMQEVYKRNWSGAIPLWEEQLNQTPKNKDKALIQNNLAVAYEITGDLDKAMSTITQAVDNYSTGIPSHKNLNAMLDYKDELLVRLKQQILIKEQMGE